MALATGRLWQWQQHQGATTPLAVPVRALPAPPNILALALAHAPPAVLCLCIWPLVFTTPRARLQSRCFPSCTTLFPGFSSLLALCGPESRTPDQHPHQHPRQHSTAPRAPE